MSQQITNARNDIGQTDGQLYLTRPPQQTTPNFKRTIFHAESAGCKMQATASILVSLEKELRTELDSSQL